MFAMFKHPPDPRKSSSTADRRSNRRDRRVSLLSRQGQNLSPGAQAAPEHFTDIESLATNTTPATSTAFWTHFGPEGLHNRQRPPTTTNSVSAGQTTDSPAANGDTHRSDGDPGVCA